MVVTHNVPVHELERGTCREISPVDYTLGKIKCWGRETEAGAGKTVRQRGTATEFRGRL